MRLVKIIFITWIIALACILIVPKLLSNTDKDIPIPDKAPNEPPQGSQIIAVIEEEHDHGPIEGKLTIGREKIQDVVNVFLDFINKGNLDDAGTMIDGNYMLDLMARDKPADQAEYIRKYVQLFEVGDLQQVKIALPTEISRNMTCRVEVQLKSGKALNLIMGLSEMTNDHEQEKLWYFTTIEKTN